MLKCILQQILYVSYVKYVYHKINLLKMGYGPSRAAGQIATLF